MTAWTKIAAELRRMYVQGGRCVLCGAKLYSVADKQPIKLLQKVYLHFVENHPEVVNALR